MMLLASVFPHVKDPWPDAIGVEFPFAVAGGFGVLADVVNADAPQEQRDRAIRRGGIWGFRIGAFFYAISLLEQLLFGQ